MIARNALVSNLCIRNGKGFLIFSYLQERNGEAHPNRPSQINPSLADLDDTGGMPYVKRKRGSIPLVSELVSFLLFYTIPPLAISPKMHFIFWLKLSNFLFQKRFSKVYGRLIVLSSLTDYDLLV